MNPIRNSAKALIVENNNLLLLKHIDQLGFWYTIPGGGQNPGETLVEALNRECLEEIGVEVEIGDLQYIREYIGINHEFHEHDGDAHQVEFLFECSIKDGNKPRFGSSPDESQIAVEWIPLPDIGNIRIYPKILANILVERDLGPIRYLGDVN